MNNLDDIFRYHVDTGGIEQVSVASNGAATNGASSFAAISGDGSIVAFQSEATNLVPGDTNGVSDVFAWGKLLSPPVTPLPTATATPTATPTPPAEPGDVNCDGLVNSIDAALVLQFGADLLDALACLQAADVSGEGVVNAIDAALILQFVAGLLDSLPP